MQYLDWIDRRHQDGRFQSNGAMGHRSGCMMSGVRPIGRKPGIVPQHIPVQSPISLSSTRRVQKAKSHRPKSACRFYHKWYHIHGRNFIPIHTAVNLVIVKSLPPLSL
jgi:hypothetical protein